MKNMRPTHLFAFIIVMLLYLAYPVYLIYRQEHILEAGEAYRLRLVPVDPFDAFRGRYLALSFDTPALPAPPGVETGDPLYISLEVDSLNFARFDRAFAEPPAGLPYLRTRAAYVDERTLVIFDLPDNLQRYYLNEETAPLAERVYQEQVLQPDAADRDSIRAYARIRVLDGEALIEELYFDGQPLREYLRSQF